MTNQIEKIKSETLILTPEQYRQTFPEAPPDMQQIYQFCLQFNARCLKVGNMIFAPFDCKSFDKNIN